MTFAGERVPREGENEHLWQNGLGVSKQLGSIVLQMLQPQAALRPSAAEVNHRVAQMYAEHPEWNTPMERAVSLCSGVQEMEGNCSTTGMYLL